MKNLKKIVIFGSEGLVARECIRTFSPDFKIILLNREQCDITNTLGVIDALTEHQPDVVINCAGMIDLNECEQNPQRAHSINALAAGNIARALKDGFSQAVFLQFSTCYVFGNEKKSYDELDAPNPINEYGKSKLAGERMIVDCLQGSGIQYFIVRTSWIYSEYRDTFVDLVIKTLKKGQELEVLVDQYNTVTWTKDLTEKCKNFIVKPENFESGIYHIAAQADTPPSKFEIACECAEICHLPTRLLLPVTSEALVVQNRPECAFLKTIKKMTLPHWKTSLRVYLTEKYS